jgi:hypothetical protein
MLVQSIDLEQFYQYSGYQIMPMLAQLDVQANNGFYRYCNKIIDLIKIRYQYFWYF